MENWTDRPTLGDLVRSAEADAASHDALEDLLSLVARCEADWRLDDRIALATAVRR